MSLRKNRLLLSERSALLASCASESWIQSRRLVRRWEKVRDRDMEAAVHFLDQYASASNSSASFFVEDPLASHEKFSGFWAHQKARLTKIGSSEEIPGISQELQEVFVVDSFADLEELNRRRGHKDRRVSEFDFQLGREDLLNLDFPFLHPNSEAFCMGLVPSNELTGDLLLDLAPAGYSFSERNWSVNTEGHFATFSVIFKKIVWNAWGHDDYAEDYVEGRGREGTPEFSRTRTWVNIQNEDVPTATTQLLGGSGGWEPDPEFAVTSVRVLNHRNGACDLKVEESQKPAEGVELSSWELLTPFSWDECQGYQYTVSLEFSGYESVELRDDAIDSVTTPEDYLAVGFRETRAGDGTYGALFTYKKVLWTNGADCADVVYHQTGETHPEGNGLVEAFRACGVGKDAVEAAFSNVSSAEDFVLSQKGFLLKGAGEFSLNYSQQRTYSGVAASDALVTQLLNGGGILKGLKRVWFRRDAGAKKTLTGRTSDGEEPPEYSYGEARSDVTVEGRQLKHASVQVVDHHDGAYTVVQVLDEVGGFQYYGGTSISDAFLYSRRREMRSRSTNVWMPVEVTISVYGKRYVYDDYASTTAAELAAWTWATNGTAPNGRPSALDVTIFDRITGEEIQVSSDSHISSSGNGFLTAYKTIYSN